MDKQEKYVEYVINELIKDTKILTTTIGYGNRTKISIYFPSNANYGVDYSVAELKESGSVFNSFPLMTDDKTHLINKYGAPDDLIEIIYDIYWIRLVKSILAKHS